ncbi:MAG: hypothetical protein WEB58_19105 [Planctomycetaceae bacterium]
MRRDLFVTCLTSALLLVAGKESFSAEEEVTVEFLKAALQSQFDSIRSITTTFTLEQRALGETAQPWGPVKYEWAAKPPQTFLREFPQDEQRRGYTVTFNGKIGYGVDPPFHEDRLTRVEIRPEASDAFAARFIPTDAIGGRVPLAVTSLTEIMTHPSCRLDGQEEIDGVSCWKVQMEATDQLAGTPILVTAFFDPSHDYLPRQIEVRRKDSQNPGWHLTWAVTEFQKLSDDTLSLQWFPLIAEFRQSVSVQTLTVEEMAINPDIPDQKFTPDFSDGAMVTDHTDPGRPRNYAMGNIDRKVERVAAAALVNELPQPAASDRTPAAVPPQGGVWWFVLLAVSAAVVAVGLALFLKR